MTDDEELTPEALREMVERTIESHAPRMFDAVAQELSDDGLVESHRTPLREAAISMARAVANTCLQAPWFEIERLREEFAAVGGTTAPLYTSQEKVHLEHEIKRLKRERQEEQDAWHAERLDLLAQVQDNADRAERAEMALIDYKRAIADGRLGLDPAGNQAALAKLGSGT